jgi:hypothetical protein
MDQPRNEQVLMEVVAMGAPGLVGVIVKDGEELIDLTAARQEFAMIIKELGQPADGLLPAVEIFPDLPEHRPEEAAQKPPSRGLLHS